MPRARHRRPRVFLCATLRAFKAAHFEFLSGLNLNPDIRLTGLNMESYSDLKAPLDAYLDGLRKSGELEKILAKYGQGSAIAKK